MPKLDLEAAKDATIPDVLPPPGAPFRVLFVGINPGLYSAATGLALRPAGQPVLAGAVRVRLHPASAQAVRAGRADRLRPRHHEHRPPRDRPGRRADRRRARGRAASASRPWSRPAAPASSLSSASRPTAPPSPAPRPSSAPSPISWPPPACGSSPTPAASTRSGSPRVSPRRSASCGRPRRVTARMTGDVGTAGPAAGAARPAAPGVRAACRKGLTRRRSGGSPWRRFRACRRPGWCRWRRLSRRDRGRGTPRAGCAGECGRGRRGPA